MNNIEKTSKASLAAIERNEYLLKKIDELLSEVKDDDYEEANACLEELNELHKKFSFFDETFEVDGLEGVMDVMGNVRVPAIYKGYYELFNYYRFDSTHLREYPVCAFNEDGKCALVTTDGKGTPLTRFAYDAISKNNFDDFYTTRKGAKMGLIDRNGSILVPCEMDMVYEPFNSIIHLEADGKFGLVTTWGLYVPPVYDEMDEKDENIYVRRGDVWGYLDENGGFIDESDQDRLDEEYLLNVSPDF